MIQFNLSWRTSLKMSNLNIAVVGAGVVGTNTIIQLQRNFPNATLTLIDDKFNDQTTSYGPAGIFRPSTHFGGMDEEITKQWAEYSYRFYHALYNEPSAGILSLDGYIFSNASPTNVKNLFLETLLPTYREADEKELRAHDNAWKYGSYFETIRVKCSSFIPWTLNRFREAGGKIRKMKLTDFADLGNEYNVIFNCAGLGAKYLCNDRHLVPIRGHLINIHAPWIKKFYYHDFDTFVIPLGDGNVALGTTRNYESYNTDVDKHDSASILERCTKLVPSVSGAEIASEWVNFRPHRHKLRLEVENRSNTTIVHNYGHGGYGITMAPGTCHQAIEDFRKYHSSTRARL